MKKSKKSNGDCGISLKGFARVQIVNGKGKIVGDSGWKKNLITNAGVWNGMAGLACALDGSSMGVFNYMGIGSTGPVSADHTGLIGLYTAQFLAAGGVNSATSSNVSSRYCTVSFSKAFDGSIASGSGQIANIGLFMGSNSSRLAAAVSYAASTLSNGQTLNATYALVFANTNT